MVKRGLFWIIIAIAVIGVSAGFYIYHLQSENPMSEQMREPTLDLGITYLPLNQNVANYYKLGVNSGALVTQVAKGGLVDQAGIKAGDIILSFNGVTVDDAAPLLGMMRSCPMGHSITMVIWSNGSTSEVTVVHPGQPGG